MNLYRTRIVYFAIAYLRRVLQRVYGLIHKRWPIDRAIMRPGNRVTFEIIPFSVLLNCSCPMGGEREREKKDEQNIEREEGKK